VAFEQQPGAGRSVGVGFCAGGGLGYADLPPSLRQYYLARDDKDVTLPAEERDRCGSGRNSILRRG